MINHDEKELSNLSANVLRDIKSNNDFRHLNSFIERAARHYHEHMVNDQDSQAILAAAKEIGRVEVAAVMYQAMGTIDASAMPEGEWMRCMDWLSSTANGEDVGELLPVGAIGEDV